MANRKPRPDTLPKEPQAILELGRLQARSDMYIGIKLYANNHVSISKTYSGVQVQQLFELLADAVKDKRI